MISRYPEISFPFNQSTFSASRNLQKVHNAVLLSRTTIMGNGVGIHLVVCPQMVFVGVSGATSLVCISIINFNIFGRVSHCSVPHLCSSGHVAHMSAMNLLQFNLSSATQFIFNLCLQSQFFCRFVYFSVLLCTRNSSKMYC